MSAYVETGRPVQTFNSMSMTRWASRGCRLMAFPCAPEKGNIKFQGVNSPCVSATRCRILKASAEDVNAYWLTFPDKSAAREKRGRKKDETLLC